MRIFSRTKSQNNENHICKNCEFSKSAGDKYFCMGKEVSPTHICRRFILDPRRLSHKKQTLAERDIEFPLID